MQVLAGIGQFQILGYQTLFGVFLLGGLGNKKAGEAHAVVEPSVCEGLLFMDGGVEVGFLVAYLASFQSGTFSIALDENQSGP